MGGSEVAPFPASYIATPAIRLQARHDQAGGGGIPPRCVCQAAGASRLAGLVPRLPNGGKTKVEAKAEPSKKVKKKKNKVGVRLASKNLTMFRQAFHVEFGRAREIGRVAQAKHKDQE